MKRLAILIIVIPFLFSCHTNPHDVTPFTIEDIALPEGLTAEVGALDFFADGRLIAAFLRGEVMIYDPATKTWSLFARGLHEPLGIHVLNDREVLVMQLPELTKLVDTDGDGSADQYETVFDGFGLTGNYHEFAYGPVEDSKGNLYIGLNSSSMRGGIGSELRGELNLDGMGDGKGMISVVPYRGWIMKIDKDGNGSPFASGLRSPNGMVIDKADRLFVTDNQGDWVGSSPMYEIVEGGFYGHPVSLIWEEDWDGGNPFQLGRQRLDARREKPAVIFPHDIIANSPTEPVLITNHKHLRPFEGQYIVGEMNTERLVRVMLEDVGGVMQGAVTPFIDHAGLRKGNNRLAFAPDGSLWVGQVDHGWLGDRGIQKITFTDHLIFDIKDMKLLTDGFGLSFTKAIDVADGGERNPRVTVRKYNYHYHEKYGSDQVNLETFSAALTATSTDKREFELNLAGIEPGYVYEITLDSVFSKGRIDTLTNKIIAYTVKQTK